MIIRGYSDRHVVFEEDGWQLCKNEPFYKQDGFHLRHLCKLLEGISNGESRVFIYRYFAGDIGTPCAYCDSVASDTIKTLFRLMK